MQTLAATEGHELQQVKALCYGGLDSLALRTAVGERLRRYLRADAFAFITIDPASGLPVDGVRDWPAAMCTVANEHVLGASPVAEFTRRARGARRAAHIDELVPEASRARDPYVDGVLHSFGFGEEVQLSIAAAGRALGNLSLARAARRPAYDASALRLLEALAPHLAAALKVARTRDELSHAVEPEVGTLVVNADGGIDLASAAAERFLSRPVARNEQSPRMVIEILVRTLHLSLDEQSDVVPAVGYRGHDVRAERVVNAAGDVRTLITIVPRRGDDPTKLTRDFGLTPREALVALGAMRGERTVDIARSLGISPYTVQDHVRHICDKLGISSRRELARVLRR